jgi:hypothetical protein
MKKCPDKQMLYDCLDKELQDSVSSDVREHINNCSTCRAELDEMTAAEKLLKENFHRVVAESSVKNKIMEQVKSLSQPQPQPQPQPPPQPPPEKKSFWLWILAPGMAIIFMAALLMSINPADRQVVKLECYAAVINSTIDGLVLTPDHTLDLSSVAAPVRFQGEFIFNLIATETTRFKLLGSATLVSFKGGSMTFSSANATLELLSGKPLQIVFNGKPKWLSTEKSISSKSSSTNQNFEAGKVATQSAETIASSSSRQTENKAADTKAALASATTPDVKTSQGNEAKDDCKQPTEQVNELPVSASETTVPKNPNPFLDKPLNLQEN